MSNTELEPRVLRLWDQLRYAYEHGGGHSGHLNNALHTAKVLSKELCKAESERDALRAALWEYAHHKAWCTNGGCDCGLNAAIDAARSKT